MEDPGKTAGLFYHHQLVPDVLDEPPHVKLVAKFGTACVELGNELTLSQTASEPTTMKWQGESDAYYTLLMTDPDAPSKQEPNMREWMHWAVVNIQGNDMGTGEVWAEYEPPAPSKESGFHRYTMLVYKQPGEIMESSEEWDVVEPGSVVGRSKFSTKDFVDKHKLEGPIAGNFFWAKD